MTNTYGLCNNPAVGICGSGLIDLIAELFLAGMIDERGKYVIRKCGDRLKEIDDINHLVIVPPEDSKTSHALTLSQPDIDALMRSKAAMYTILTTYLELNVNQEFMNAFSAAKFIPHTDRSLFPSVKVRAS
ncbi:MAG: ASKHA domain-containing protein [Pseudomonadota bacterium]